MIPRHHVPCGSCPACCQGAHAVVLLPPDDIESYEVTFAPVSAELGAKLGEASPEVLWDVEQFSPYLPPAIVAEFRVKGITTFVVQLAHRANGDCVYLGDNGCTIHDRAPTVCRLFDCRTLFTGTTRNERRAAIKSGDTSKEVFAAGRERLHTLSLTGGAP
jgi:Fe-S-cluster containining protein